MKFKFKLSPSNAYQKQFNSDYLNPVDIDSLDAFKGICTHDYVCASYKDNHRSKTRVSEIKPRINFDNLSE